MTPCYLLMYDYGENAAERRAPHRAAHLELARAAQDRGELLLGGAFGDTVDGAVLLFQADSAAAAETFARRDPYVTSGLVTRWRVRPWSIVVGALTDRLDRGGAAPDCRREEHV